MPPPRLLRTLLDIPGIALARLAGRLRRRVAPLATPAGGLTLIADAGNHRVIEVDGAGTIAWQYGSTGVAGRGANQLHTPRDAKRLANGRTLVADSANHRVIEVERDGTLVWTFDDLQHPRSAARLANGNTLIADYENHRVIEINGAGAIQWSYGERGVAGSEPGRLRRPRHAERLPGGNTLIADELNRVIEVNPSGLIVWEFSTRVPINSARRLAGGHTLMAVDGSFLSFGVLEVDPAGVLQWWYMSLHTSDATRLPNGNTLLAIPSRAHVIEVDADRNIVWEYGTFDVPGGGVNQLHDPWEASRLSSAPGRPDLSVRAVDPAYGAAFTGIGVFGPDGSNQTLGPLHLGGHDDFALRLTNAGAGTGAFTVTAAFREVPAQRPEYGTGWSVRFHDAPTGGADITADMLAGGWTTAALAPGASADFRVQVRNLNRGASEQMHLTVTARAVADPALADAVTTITQAPHIV